MRIVLDTNVLVSALVAASSTPAQILARCHSGELELVVSPASLAELHRVLAYPHIRRRLQYSDEQIEGYMAYLEQTAILLTPRLTVQAVPDDPDDDRFVALALEAQAPYLVSGDKHLLSVGHYAGVTILKPAAFLQLWQTLHPEPPQG